MGDRMTACMHACLSEKSDSIRIEALLASNATIHCVGLRAPGAEIVVADCFTTYRPLPLPLHTSVSISATCHPLPPFISLLCGPPCSFACPYPVPPTVMSRTRHNTILSNTSRHFSSLISSMSVEILHPFILPRLSHALKKGF